MTYKALNLLIPVVAKLPEPLFNLAMNQLHAANYTTYTSVFVRWYGTNM